MKNKILIFVAGILFLFSFISLASAANSNGILQIWRNSSTGANVTWVDNNGNLYTLGKINTSGTIYEGGTALSSKYYGINNPYGYYNSTNPSPVINSSYYLATNPFGFYNSTNFLISDYYLKSNPYGYYNSTNLPPSISGSGTAWYIPMWNGTTSLNNSAIYQNGTNIGIGTTSPGTKLEINGNLTLTNWEQYLYLGNSGGYSIGRTNGNLLTLDTGSIHRLAIDINGNVGIATTTPQNKLNVVGDINATTNIYGGTIYEGGTALSSKYYGINNPSGFYNLTSFDINNYYLKSNPFGFYNSTNPQTEVDPKWTGNSTLVPYLASANTFTNNNIFNQNLTVATNALFVNGNSGNVGIGTTSPSAKLEVNGEVNFSSSGVKTFTEGGALIVSG